MHALFHHFKKILARLVPYQCVLCGNRSNQARDLCSHCQQDLPVINHPCPHCAKEMITEKHCDFCLKETVFFDVTHALYAYEYPVTRLILTLKFNNALLYGKILGDLLAEKLLQLYAEKNLPQVIIPMPLHKKRLRERGFNQAIEIARPVAKQLNLPMDLTYCQRQKYTLAQAKLSAKKRKANLKASFIVTNNLPYEHVALLDDVVTTGNTINECAKTLKTHGVKKVDIWCVARARMK